MRNELSQAFGTLAEGFFLCSSGISAYYSSLCSCAWPQRARKRQLMPIRIEQMEIPFAPRSILRLFGPESQIVEASPDRVHIRDMEDKPTPAVDRLTLLQI